VPLRLHEVIAPAAARPLLRIAASRSVGWPGPTLLAIGPPRTGVRVSRKRRGNSPRADATISTELAARRQLVVQITVADQGPGVSLADIERLFRPFVQGTPVARRVQGRRVKLAICRRIVSAHGSHIKPFPT
jgi:signal transduction histidine kinase